MDVRTSIGLLYRKEYFTKICKLDTKKMEERYSTGLLTSFSKGWLVYANFLLDLSEHRRIKLHSHTYTVTEPPYTVKKVSNFPFPSCNVTNQTLPGRE
jgi:hypothetical protein